MNKDISEVCSYLRMKSINIPVSNDWLTSCIECFKEQGNYSLQELKELVYQQWLLADLCDIAAQVLPESCHSNNKTLLQGRYAVQLNYVINIAVSFHKQLQKIRCPDSLKNLEMDCEASTQSNKEPVGTRTLKIEMTDGVIKLVGFEDKLIPALQEPLVPGKKAVLIGPIECRKGILFLKSCNIQLLGGEVDALHIRNATENILARTLKLPENPDPYHQFKMPDLPDQCNLDSCKSVMNNQYKVNSDCFDDDEEAMMILADVIENEVSPDVTRRISSQYTSITERQPVTTATHREQPKQPEANFNVIVSGSNNIKESVRSTVTNQLHEYKNNLVANDFGIMDSRGNIADSTCIIDFDDDFELMAAETASTVEKDQSKKHCTDNFCSDIPLMETFDSTSSKRDYEKITELKKKLHESYGVGSIESQSVSTSKLLPSHSRFGDKIIVDYLSDSKSPLLTEDFASQVSNTASQNCVSSNVPDNYFNSDPFPPRKRPSIITASGKVIKIVKKPKLKGNQWSVSAIVKARGVELEVSFASEVIDKIFTVSAAEIIARKEQLVSDPSMKQKMNEALKRSQEKFSKLACEMVFSFKDAISDPVVIDIVEK